MILNNSGIVHCATRTRGREETAMNMQELLTYVEELTFKTSMFGYDKDEVDIQLDKICDEAEAIILAKEKEIEELKKESKTALGIAAAATGKTMEELEKDTQEDIVETEEHTVKAFRVVSMTVPCVSLITCCTCCIPLCRLSLRKSGNTSTVQKRRLKKDKPA